MGLGSSSHGLWEGRTAADSVTLFQVSHLRACRETQSESGVHSVKPLTPRLERILPFAKDTRT